MTMTDHSTLTRYTPAQWRVLGCLHTHRSYANPGVSLRGVLSKQDATKDDVVQLRGYGLVVAVSAADGTAVDLDRTDWQRVLGTRRRLIDLRITNRGSRAVYGQPEIMIAGSIHRPPRGGQRKYPAAEISRSAGLSGGTFTVVYRQMIERRLAVLYTGDGEQLTLRAAQMARNLATNDYRCGLTRGGTAYLERWR